MNLSALDRRHAFVAFLAYLAFVVYGSLVPFEYRDRTLDEAIRAFTTIRYLSLGVVSRADWVANIVLYVPLAFLGCAWIMRMRSVSAFRHLAAVFVFVICIAVAVAVEFTQLFFAPRTVSLNDLLAETLGTLGGIALWSLGRWRIARLLDAFTAGGRQSVFAAIAVYGLLYVALSLFPYDFIVSMSELEWKLASGSQGWLIAGGCADGLRCAARQAAEVVAIAPLGMLVALAAPAASYRRIFVAGVLLGAVLEVLQLFIASGTSQGLSVLLRGVGLVAGLAAGNALRHYGPAWIARIVWRTALFAVLPYLLLLAALGGWFSASWLPLDKALARLAEVRLMPFYYHYYTSEPVAMASLLAQACMYAPVGLAIWARQLVVAPVRRRRALAPVPWAVMLALPIELGKLMVPSQHPDFTNLLIGAGSAAFTYTLACWVERILTGARPGPGRGMEPVVPPARAPAVERGSLRPVPALAGIALALAAVSGVAAYPVGAPWLALLLAGYAVLLWRRPSFWLFMVPALLPVLDLSPVTGRLLLDEFDLVVLVTLALGYWRGRAIKPLPWPHPLMPAAVGLLWLTWALSTARGIWPLLDWDGAVSDSSHSPLEAWFVGKGLLWALLIVPLLRRVPREEWDAAQRRILNGLVAGLAALTLVVLWERHVFVGLGDFENIFRVTGTFSSMHTGGAYIEAFIAFAFPALAAWVLMQRGWPLKLAGLGLVALASYAMMVTFSRGGYAGFAAGLVLVILGALCLRTGALRYRGLALAGLAAASVAVAIPIVSGGFAQYRLARAAGDLASREAHWARALGLMDNGPVAALMGMGFGQYPSLYLLRADSARPPGTFSLMHDSGNPYLRLGGGEMAYLDQLVDVEPGGRYRLSARIRQPYGKAALSVSLCEKALLYSFGCVSRRFTPKARAGEWETVTALLNAGKLGGGGGWPHRPVKLSLYNPGAKGAIDLDDVSLKAADGRELLANGDFSEGAARWLFITDQDLAWHIHQQELEMYFAQGVLGLAALAVLLIAVARVLWPVLPGGNMRATAFAGALTAFLTVGLLGSTMDTARLSMLFYLGAFCAGLLTRRHAGGAR
ncbi:MAG TPA: VanZ family protein [Sedimenticola sp.]|nr:VanZ family protein [Sedimenticola sp.]